MPSSDDGSPCQRNLSKYCTSFRWPLLKLKECNHVEEKFQIFKFLDCKNYFIKCYINTLEKEIHQIFHVNMFTLTRLLWKHFMRSIELLCHYAPEMISLGSLEKILFCNIQKLSMKLKKVTFNFHNTVYYHTQCGNCCNLVSRIFGKNFVKVT